MTYSVTLSKQAPHDPAALKLWREATAIRSLRIRTEDELSRFDQKPADMLRGSTDILVQDRSVGETAKSPAHVLSGFLQRGEFNLLELMQVEIKKDDATIEIFVDRQPDETKTILRKIVGTQLQGQWTLHENSLNSTLFMEYEPSSC